MAVSNIKAVLSEDISKYGKWSRMWKIIPAQRSEQNGNPW